MAARRVIAFVPEPSGEGIGEVLRAHIAHGRWRERRERLFPVFVGASLLVWLADACHGVVSDGAEVLLLCLWAVVFAVLLASRWIEWRWDRRRDRLLSEPPRPAML